MVAVMIMYPKVYTSMRVIFACFRSATAKHWHRESNSHNVATRDNWLIWKAVVLVSLFASRLLSNLG